MSDNLQPADETSQDPAGQDDDGRWRTSLLVPVAIIAIAIGLIGAIIIVAREEQGQGEAALAGATVDTASLPVTVPYRDVAGYIVIDVTFGDGGRTLPMVLDSGAPTIITEELSQVFAGPAAGTIATTSVDGRVSTSTVVPVPRLAIGAAEFSDVGAVVGSIEPGNPLYCITDSGFIGSSLLQAAVWQIDPRTQRLTIAADIAQLPALDDATSFAFSRASAFSPSPLIEIEAGDGEMTLAVDTGSDGWITANPDDLASASITLGPAIPTESVVSTGAGGSFGTRVRWTSADLTLGAQPRAMLLSTSDVVPSGQGSIGTDFLKHHVVTLDWLADTVYLQPLAATQAPSPSIPMSSAPGWNDGYVVGSFVEGLPQNVGLDLGAEVVAIDGRDVSTVPFSDFCSGLTGDPAIDEMTVAGAVPMTVSVAPVEDFFAPLADQ